jgi:flagellar motility protein MotE (MotC chaperone)
MRFNVRLSSMKKPSVGVKALLATKFLLVVSIWLAYDHGFTLGDREAKAKDDPPKSGSAPGSAASKEKNAGKTPSDSEVKTAASVNKEEGPRKSFLSNLLELPKLETDSMRKEELGKYLEIAERKDRQLKERLNMLKNREEQLKSLESSIDGKLNKLDEERKFFAQTIQQEKDMKNERVSQLIGMYAKMEPKKAAPVFEKLDKDLVVELFKKLPQKQVTAILETMSPDKSVQLSEYYGRVRSAREYDVLKEMNQSLRKEFDDCKGMPNTKS